MTRPSVRSLRSLVVASTLTGILVIGVASPAAAIEPTTCEVVLDQATTQQAPRIVYLSAEVDPVGDAVLTFNTEMLPEFGGEVREGTMEGSGRVFVVHPVRAYWKAAFRPASDSVTSVSVVLESPGVCRDESSAEVAPALPDTATDALAPPARLLIVLGLLLSLAGFGVRRASRRI